MSFVLRVKFLLGLLLIIFLILTARLFFWQVLNGRILANQGQDQYDFTQKIYGNRGKIFDRNGAVLVDNQYYFNLFLNKKKHDKSFDLSKTLAPIFFHYYSKLPISTGSAIISLKEWQGNINLLIDSKNPWELLGRNFDKETIDKVLQTKISGLDYYSVASRFYPVSTGSAHLFGFLGQDKNSNPKGYFGLEGYYDRELSARSFLVTKEVDASGKPMILNSQEMDMPNAFGRDLKTSLDKNVQNFVEVYLEQGVKTWGAISGSVIVMEPNTGQILAMASYPSYHPSFYNQFPTAVYKNPAVADNFEPGSIMKPLIVAAGLNEGVITPTTSCNKCSGPRAVEGGVIKTFNEQYHPNLTMTEVLQYSDNTGMVFVGEKLGKERLLRYLDKFQFGKLTGIDLEEEESGDVKSGNQWYPLDLATVTFGQGISVTAIQMARLYAMLANGGNLVKPQIVTTIIDNGKQTEIKPMMSSRNVLTGDTVKEITNMLVSVTEKSPLHFPRDRIFGLSKYKIAAKSGTAQIPVAGKYNDQDTIASVIGYAPADDPKFVVYVKLNQPSVRIWGSDTAGPIFYNIIHDLLLYYNISP